MKGRTLRLSVTDRCNLRCRYCMPEEGVGLLPRGSLPDLETLEGAVSWLIDRFEVRRLRITGGEPLVRRGLAEFIARVSLARRLEEVSLTTNGTLLAGSARALKAAGVARVNISLDSLDPRRFSDITGGGRLEDALAGLEEALEAGLTPVKLNAVLTRSHWREDVPALMDLAADRGLTLRFIELMGTGPGAAWAAPEFVPATAVQSELGIEACGAVADRPGSPARYATVPWKGAVLRVGWITPVSRSFCGTCDRLRLDARGRLRRCLMDPEFLDLAALLGSREPEAFGVVSRWLGAKRPPETMVSETPMAAIGG